MDINATETLIKNINEMPLATSHRGRILLEAGIALERLGNMPSLRVPEAKAEITRWEKLLKAIRVPNDMIQVGGGCLEDVATEIQLHRRSAQER